MSASGFTVDIFQDACLPGGTRDVYAVVTVTAAGSVADGPASAASAAEIIIIDCSGSMAEPMAKMDQACEAAGAAIRDGVAFAVVAGNERARPVYPVDGILAIAGARTRQAARSALAGLRPAAGPRSGNGCCSPASSSRRAGISAGTRS